MVSSFPVFPVILINSPHLDVLGKFIIVVVLDGTLIEDLVTFY